MKKLHYLLPLLLSIVACGTQPAPNVTDMVNATLTAVAQANSQEIPNQSQPLPSDSSSPAGSMVYFWPRALPEGFVLSREISNAAENGFTLTFINPASGAISLMGGAEVAQNCDNDPGEVVTVRGLGGCFPPGTGGGFAVSWKENNTYYSVGGAGVSKEAALALAENLDALDLSSFLARLGP